MGDTPTPLWLSANIMARSVIRVSVNMKASDARKRAVKKEITIRPRPLHHSQTQIYSTHLQSLQILPP